MKKQTATVTMDSRQRVCLTRVLSKEEIENFNSFRLYRTDGKIVLEPTVEVPSKDHWIYKNPAALISLMKGINDAEEGRLHNLGSFSKYATENDDEK